MNDRRTYGDDPYSRRPGEPSAYGYDPNQEPPARGPRPETPYGAPPPRPVPPRQTRPTHDGPQTRPPARGGWDDDENTRLIGKLGYVPPEARSMDPEQDRFNLDRLHDSDAKVQSRRRAKKASPLARIGVVVAVIAVVAALGGGVWWLASGEDETTTATDAYEVLDAPCSALDTSPLDDLSAGTSELPPLEETKPIGSKTDQVCALSLSAEAGTGVDVEISSTVFAREAGARNEFRNAAEDAEEAQAENRVYAEADGPGTDAFTVSRPWAEDTGSADFSLYLYDGNAYLHVRVTIYSSTAVSEDDIAKRTAEVAEKYLANWQG